jgi:DNA-binding MarR family transcriptional regulator
MLLAALLGQFGARLECCAEECGLPVAQAAALVKLDSPVSMHELAERLGCHTSNATGITDRLAARGLVERKDEPGDRRVKKVGLTAEGLRAREHLRQCIESSTSPLGSLTAGQRRELRSLLMAAVDAEGPNLEEAARRGARMMGVHTSA